MNMLEKKFFESDIPRIVTALEKIAKLNKPKMSGDEMFDGIMESLDKITIRGKKMIHKDEQEQVLEQEQELHRTEKLIKMMQILHNNGYTPSDMGDLIGPDTLEVMDTLTSNGRSLETLSTLLMATKFDIEDYGDFWGEIQDKLNNILQD